MQSKEDSHIENVSPEAENARLKAKCTYLEAANASLKDRNAALESATTSLEASNASLRSSNSSLQDEVVTLKEKIYFESQSYEILYQSNLKLQASRTHGPFCNVSDSDPHIVFPMPKEGLPFLQDIDTTLASNASGLDGGEQSAAWSVAGVQEEILSMMIPGTVSIYAVDTGHPSVWSKRQHRNSLLNTIKYRRARRVDPKLCEDPLYKDLDLPKPEDPEFEPTQVQIASKEYFRCMDCNDVYHKTPFHLHHYLCREHKEFQQKKILALMTLPALPGAPDASGPTVRSSMSHGMAPDHAFHQNFPPLQQRSVLRPRSSDVRSQTTSSALAMRTSRYSQTVMTPRDQSYACNDAVSQPDPPANAPRGPRNTSM